MRLTVENIFDTQPDGGYGDTFGHQVGYSSACFVTAEDINDSTASKLVAGKNLAGIVLPDFDPDATHEQFGFGD